MKGYTHSSAVGGDIVDREGMVEVEAPGERLAGKEGETKGGRKESERVGSKRDIRKSERKEREGEEKWTVYTDQRVS